MYVDPAFTAEGILAPPAAYLREAARRVRALGGLLVAVILSARGMRGAILLGILAATALGLIFGVLHGPSKVAELPSSVRGSGGFGSTGGHRSGGQW